jgi:hypothetical protein
VLDALHTEQDGATGNFVVVEGARLHSDLGFNGECSWQDLPPKSSVIAATGAWRQRPAIFRHRKPAAPHPVKS